MSIIISTEPMADGQIIVTVEGYPHAQPAFADTLTGQDLQDAVDAWAINQDEVDSLNNGTATQATLDKVEAERLAQLRINELPQVISAGIEVPKVVFKDVETGVAYAFVADGADLIGFEQHASPTPDDATLEQRMLQSKTDRRNLRLEVKAERYALNLVIDASQITKTAIQALNGTDFTGAQQTLINALLSALLATQNQLIDTEKECKKLSQSVLQVVKGI